MTLVHIVGAKLLMGIGREVGWKIMFYIAQSKRAITKKKFEI